MICMCVFVYSCFVKNPSTCSWLDMFLVNNLSFYDGGVTIGRGQPAKIWH
jgi:hypothetical protein